MRLKERLKPLRYHPLGDDPRLLFQIRYTSPLGPDSDAVSVPRAGNNERSKNMAQMTMIERNGIEDCLKRGWTIGDQKGQGIRRVRAY